MLPKSVMDSEKVCYRGGIAARSGAGMSGGGVGDFEGGGAVCWVVLGRLDRT